MIGGITGAGSRIFGIGPVGAAKGASGAGTTEFEKILDAFRKEASKTPAERARDKVLERHKLDEDGYRRLPSAEKTRIDTEIAEAVKRVTARKAEGGSSEGLGATISRLD